MKHIPFLVVPQRPISITNLMQFLLLTSLLLALSGCNKPQEAANPAPEQKAPPPAKVKIAQPLTRQVTDWDEYTGRIEAVNSVDVRARASGYLEKVNFKAGALVQKGDLLFVIDQRPFKVKLNAAQAELTKAQTQLELAKNELTRAQNLIKAKAISVEEFDARQKAVKEATAAVDSQKAQVDEAKLNLQFTEVRAPISGRISQELVDAGNAINGGDIDPTKLATIVSVKPVYMSVDVDERAILAYRRAAQKQGKKLEGTTVELALADEQGYPHQGHVDYVAPMENTATGTVTVRSVFENAKDLLSPGFFARLRIRGGAAYSGFLLPDRAIGSDQADRIVWVMNADKKVQQRKIIPGKKFADLRVIRQGLQGNEWVVIEGVQKLKPDAQIEPEKITLTPPAAEQ